MLDVHLTQHPPFNEHSHCVVVAVGSGQPLPVSTQEADSALAGLIGTLIDRGSVSGELGRALTVPLLDNDKADYLLVVGGGNKTTMSAHDYGKLLSTAYRALSDIGVKSAAIYLSGLDVAERDEHWKIRQQVEAAAEACYRINSMASQAGTGPALTKITLECDAPCYEAVAQGLAVAEGTNICKDLGNLPANICTPSYLAQQAQTLATQHKLLSTTVLDEDQMRELGMGVLLSVGAGSDQPSRLVVMHYKGGKTGDKPHVMVGKGITYDTGGICIKNREGMSLMKYDMGGAAAVIGAVTAAARLGLELNVIGVLACAENMPSGSATKPSDVVTSMSGKTVEILNTDAEGRLVLCDALTYVERFDPASVVDVATLTGACVMALGRHYSGLFANDNALAEKLLAAGSESMDQAWQLPLSPEDMPQLDTEFADIANMGDGTAGAVVAALFLSRFAEAYPWAHLDVSGTAKRVKPSKGATGRPVPLLVQYLLGLDPGGAKSE